MNKKNQISSILNNCNNLVDIFNYHKKKTPEKKIFFEKKSENWNSISFTESSKRIEKIIDFFIEKKLKKNDRVFLLSSNRIEWVEFDLAIMSVGCITVPSFVTNNQADNKFIINDCNPSLIILENEEIFEKNKKFLNKFKEIIILIDPSMKFYNYRDIQKRKNLKKNKAKVFKNDISSIIYTSGTTGNPKGVILSHRSIMHNLLGAIELISDFNLNKERFISFLPLSHSYERMAGLYFALLINAEIFFCTSTEKLLLEIKEVQPTILSAVPRLYESIYKKIKSQIRSSSKLVSFFLSITFNLIDKKKNLNILQIILGKLFIKLILKKKILNIFGNKIKVLISGGAALNPSVGFFFNSLAIYLLQGYGQTEASPLISCNRKNSNDPKTVGLPVKDVKVRISSDGEILVSGKNLMDGYWKQKSLTKKTINNGWLHTGDLGEIDEKGRIIITGRKKDLIVTSGGENISVQKIENMLLDIDEISQAVIYGDNKPFLIAMIKINDEYKNCDLKGIISNLNLKLNSVEKIRKFVLINKEMSYENGFMTQTLKIKKDKVFKFYEKEIKKLYHNL